MFEQAKWIERDSWTAQWAFPDRQKPLPTPYMARTFTVKAPLSRATLSVVAYGQAAYYLNGARLPDSHLPTQQTDPTKTVVYNTYDLTPHLYEGKNRFGMLLGNADYGFTTQLWRSTAKALVQIDLVYKDGTTESVVSDTQFRTAPSPMLDSRFLGGETYDARLEIDGWCDADFDDSAWARARICAGPGGRLRPILCPPIRAMEERAGTEIAPGVYDFGINTSGWVRIRVRGAAGDEVVIRYSERLYEDKTHIDRRWLCNRGEESHTDRYILKDSPDAQVWEVQTLYHGFQYAEVTLPADCVLEEITAIVAYTDLQSVSHFSCDDERLNHLYRASLNSILTNCHGLLTDCPHREQGAWTGDAAASAQAVNCQFDAFGLFYEWLHHFRDAQLPDGRMPSYVPCDGPWTYSFACGADWDSAMIHLPYYTYKYSGDRRIIDMCWDNMCALLSYFHTLTEDGILTRALGDWNAMVRGGENNKHAHGGIPLVATCFYGIDAYMMAELAEATGRDSAPFYALHARIRDAFRARFFAGERLDSDVDSAIALTAWAHFYTESEERAEVARLAALLRERDNVALCGIHGMRCLFELLCRHGYAQLAYDVITNEAHPGFASVWLHNRSTLPEKLNFHEFAQANGGNPNSLNHHYFSPVILYFFRSLAGIRIEGFGYDNVVIEPQFVSGVTRVDADCHGIHVAYDANTLTIDCPYPFTLLWNGARKAMEKGRYTLSR